MILRHIIFFFFFLFSPLVVHSQVDWRINGEAGLYNSSGDAVLESSGLITRLDSFLKYKYENENRNASIQLRLRPELYGANHSVSSIKIKADGDYYQVENDLRWGTNISVQRSFFNANAIDFTYDIFSVAANAFWNDIDLNTNIGYAYQFIKGKDDYSLELLFLDLKLFQPFSTYTKSGYGFYVERFFVSNKITLTSDQSENENKGWRIGPEVDFTYLKDIILSIDYRFLFHESKFIRYLSYEHWIRIVAGKIFFSYLSAFLLADYNFYKFVKSGNYVEAITPLYTPLNLENKIYLKIAYDLSDNIEVYIKTGYFKESLYEDKFSLEGWNAMIGIELNKGM
jgi:hypothetical protein